MGNRILAEGEAATALRVSRYCRSVAFWLSFEAASLGSSSAFGAEDGGLSLALCLEDRRLLLALCLQRYGLSLAVGLGNHGPPLPFGGYLPAGRSPRLNEVSWTAPERAGRRLRRRRFLRRLRRILLSTRRRQVS
jgi:hypothetical protein